jgi:sulfoxide reductase catalytic subunit YedY
MHGRCSVIRERVIRNVADFVTSHRYNMLIKKHREWALREREVTPESAYLNRRQLIQAAGFLGIGGVLEAATGGGPYPAKRNGEYMLDRPITEEIAAESYNNFYEFETDKAGVKNKVGKFITRPWTIEIGGLVRKPKTFDVDQLERSMPLEERVYAHRCVEAWSMVVPWTGFPFADIVKQVEPKPEAKFVRFISANRPDQMPGIISQPWYPWPYFEGLRMDEAMHPLAFMVTGLYGKPLPKQNGAPIRMVLPWKYGYKSTKSIVKIEFVAAQPPTFWNQLQPAEFGFYSNVNPHKPHPRWSQATEKVIPTMERRQTQIYNGYEKWVSSLYHGTEI